MNSGFETLLFFLIEFLELVELLFRLFIVFLDKVFNLLFLLLNLTFKLSFTLFESLFFLGKLIELFRVHILELVKSDVLLLFSFSEGFL